MKSSLLLLLLFLLLLPAAYTQPKSEFTKADNIARSVPDSVAQSPASLSSFFKSRLTSQRDLVRAIYTWTATNISYDVANMYTINTSDNPAAVVLKTMGDRKAVCQGYAEVFRELCANCGIESYVIHGYTRQNGAIAGMPHAWVVAVVDHLWYFFDPTWGSGYVEGGRFVKRFTADYFMVAPVRQIRSHMPYDPMWQCLFRPFTSSDFYNSKQVPKTDTSLFMFADSIAVYLTMSKEQQNAATLRRVEKNGIVNNSLFEYARYLRQNNEIYKINREIDQRNREIERQGKVVDQFNIAVNHYNASVSLFGDYISYYNRQFKPMKPEAVIRHMVDTCDRELKIAANLLAGLVMDDEKLKRNMSDLAPSILDMQKKVREQQLFLQNYFGTAKPFRSDLFRKSSFFGVPINR
jgi:hypothetical protein